jgi:hypothetical protein
MTSILYYTNTLSWIFVLLVDSNNSPQVYMSVLFDTLCRFQANKSLLLLLTTRQRLKPTIYRTWDENANHFITDAIYLLL